MLDTAHFTGNQVPRFALSGACLDSKDPRAEALARERISCFNGGQCQAKDPSAMAAAAALHSEQWKQIIKPTPLNPGYEETRRHYFEVDEEVMGIDGKGWTHIRLDQFPDGGIARLRVYGEVFNPDLLERQSKLGIPLDLAAASNGGVPIVCSNKHYGSPANLIAPGRAAKMDEGWETARNPNRPAVLKALPSGKLDLAPEMRDYAIIRLATVGVVSGLEIDTNHFKGNCPESCVVEGYLAPERAGGETHSHMGDQSLQQKFAQTEEVIKWEPILPRCALQPHKQHYFKAEDLAPQKHAFSHVKISIFPDGGISRLRVLGLPAKRQSSL